MRLPRKTTLFLSVLLLALTRPAASVAQSQPAAAADSATREDIENFLRTAKITKSKVLPVGVTLPQKLTLTDGKVTRYGVFKTIDVHKTGATELSDSTQVDFKDSWKYEVVAYELDKLLSLNMVPVTVERMKGSERGSLQIWIDDAMMEADRLKKKLTPPDPEAWNQAMYKVRVFHNLTYNFDENVGNVLIGPDWKLYIIDHSRSFKIFGKLRSPEGLTRFSVSLMEALKKLDKAEVKAKCGRYLTGPEIDGVLERRDKILELYTRLVAEKGSSITYP